MLQVNGQVRDLAMFNVAIDSKLRGCDVVNLKVEDVAPNGLAVDRATVRQRKTGHPVRFELTEQTRQAIDDYIRFAGKKPGDFLFTSRRKPKNCLSTRNMRDWYRNGSRLSDWTLAFSAPIRCAEPRRRPHLSSHWQP
jgi:integrase